MKMVGAKRFIKEPTLIEAVTKIGERMAEQVTAKARGVAEAVREVLRARQTDHIEWERRSIRRASRSVTHRYVTERYTFQSDSQPQLI
ncbi:hypothetical protein EVAR_95427_1 [Eumeta japonica]|uniref:Uncharacterized protein n=1 Tax=Eumeta variegata TaxID=151549 RepID=A0A4C1VL99_EUMVA|nr:hypothetical protein EVAR_95427_1 [Eumeta japonica]